MSRLPCETLAVLKFKLCFYQICAKFKLIILYVEKLNAFIFSLISVQANNHMTATVLLSLLR